MAKEVSIKPPVAFATVFPGQKTAVDPRLIVIARTIEKQLDCRVFCLIHHPEGENYQIDTFSSYMFGRAARSIHKQPKGKPIAILLHSPGGDAHAAFRLARALIRHCGSYSVIIPHYAKSAATLFSLGASKIYLGECAELGPIDVQVADPERERELSALEMVQSLERLNSEAMQIVDTMMVSLMNRSGKRIESLLPHVLKYAADITRPIFEKIDTVGFTYHARLLKIGEDYAKMLLRPVYGAELAERIAYSLTRKYPDHGFVIDRDEAEEIGLEFLPIPDNLCEPLEHSPLSYTKGTVVGFLEDEHAAKTNENKAQSTKPATRPGPQRSARRNGTQRRTRDRVGQNGPLEFLE